MSEFNDSELRERRAQPDRREEAPESWHLKKEISGSLIISVIVLGASVVFAYTDLQRDNAVLQAAQVDLVKQDIRLKAEIDAISSATSARFDRIDAKLDRLIERGTK